MTESVIDKLKFTQRVEQSKETAIKFWQISIGLSIQKDRHSSLSSATTEARRLTRSHPQSHIYVLELVACFGATVIPEGIEIIDQSE